MGLLIGTGSIVEVRLNLIRFVVQTFKSTENLGTSLDHITFPFLTFFDMAFRQSAISRNSLMQPSKPGETSHQNHTNHSILFEYRIHRISLIASPDVAAIPS